MVPYSLAISYIIAFLVSYFYLGFLYHFRNLVDVFGDVDHDVFEDAVKAAISLYVYTGSKEHEHLLKDLGKFKIGKACIYIKKLSDIDQEALKRLMRATINFLEEKYGRI